FRSGTDSDRAIDVCYSWCLNRRTREGDHRWNSRRLRHWIGSNVCRSDLRRVDESSALTRPGRCQLPSAKPLDLSARAYPWRTRWSSRLPLRSRTRLLLSKPALACLVISLPLSHVRGSATYFQKFLMIYGAARVFALNCGASFLDQKRNQRQRCHAVEPPPPQDPRCSKSDH